MDTTTQARPASTLASGIETAARALETQVIAWRRDFHANPELGNREFRTAGIVAEHLRKLGFDEVTTGVAHTGVVGLLKGVRPGPVVALRADMDALPVAEEVDLPFASKVRAEWNGEQVGVMHACGHDAHVAILMGVAEVLAGLRAQLRGTLKFIFQPAEELPPEGEEGGAKMMVEQGVMDNPRPDAVFGLHVTSRLPVGVIGYRPGPAMASADTLRITIHGRQTHGAMPWYGVDPIVTSAQVVLGLQTIVSRETDLTHEPAVVTIGAIKGGVRENIIPDSVEMRGTIRSFDEACCLTKECYSSGCCRSGCLFESSIVEGCGHVVEGGGGGQRSRAAARCPRSPPVRRRRIVHMSMACRARSARPPVGAKFSLSCGFRLQPASHQARAGDPEPCLSLARRARP